MIIRKLSKKDFEQFLQMEKSFAADNKKVVKQKVFKYKIIDSECKKDFLNKISNKTGYFFAVEENAELVGYMYGKILVLPKGYGTDKLGYINKIYTDRRYRGRGLASKLVKGYFEFLRCKGIKHCCIDVSIDNINALEIYKHFGFKPFEYKMYTELER